MICNLDIETYSSYDLPKCGLYRYVEAPDFEILMISYAEDYGEVKQIDLTVGPAYQSGAEWKRLCTILKSPDIELHAFNAAFERICINKFFNIDIPSSRYRCTMVKSLSCGLPGNLAGAGLALGLPEDKLKDPKGKALITYFSKPCRATKTNGGRTRNRPCDDLAKWSDYLSYNRQDVVTEMEIDKKLSQFPMVDSEWRLWELDQDINDRGILIDVPMVKKIVKYDSVRREELTQEAKDLTELDNPNSTMQLRKYLSSKGIEVQSIDKDTVKSLLADTELDPDARRVLEIRQALGKTSVKKYDAMLSSACDDGRIRGILQFYGANRTGRWAGRLVQVHNLARNSLRDLDLARRFAAAGDFESIHEFFGETSFIFSELVRTAFIPKPGHIFVVTDFSAIEARVLAWLAGERWVLEAFKAGKDIYCETASMMYKVPVEKHGANSELRQKGKIATLACGYQGGIGAMKSMDKGGSIPEEELQSVVDIWRRANPKIVRFWSHCEKATKAAILDRRVVKLNNLQFSYSGGNLFIKLPSGRNICYWKADVKNDVISEWKQSIVYKGVNQTTKAYEEIETYGGKIVENITQAVARDCLAEVMKKVTDAGYNVVMHVHDEMIIEAPADDAKAVETINQIMGDPISWAPTLPLKGDTYTTPFYKKD